MTLGLLTPFRSFLFCLESASPPVLSRATPCPAGVHYNRPKD